MYTWNAGLSVVDISTGTCGYTQLYIDTGVMVAHVHVYICVYL